MKNIVNIEISWHTLLKFFIFCLLVVGIYFARGVLELLFVAIVLSLALDPLITFLETKKIKRLWGTVIVFFSGFLLLGFTMYFFIPVIVIEASSFLKHIHETIYTIFGIGLPDNLIDVLTFGRDQFFNFLSNEDISIAGTLASFLKKGIFVIATFLIAFYLCIERQGTERLLRVILPDQYEAPVLKVFERFKIKIRRWFIAQFILSLVVGIFVTVGLWLLGVRYPILIGVFAMIFELVPVIGPILIGSIAFLVAVSDSFILGIYTVIFFVAVQQFENHILVPMVIGKTMKVHPVVVIASLLVGAEIAGFVGIVLAVPIAVLSQEIFNYLAEKKDTRMTSRLKV